MQTQTQTLPGGLEGLLQQKRSTLCCESKDDSKDVALHGLRDVYDIPALAALELLSFNIECLEKTTATPGDLMDSPAVDSVPKVELHASPAANEEQEQAPGHDAIQLSVLSKRFVSKNVPPISLRDYLLRLHKYCPMSTAVYLATSLYFTRLVAIDRLLPVTPKNMHRLVLAGLQVAMKALEDLSYPHSRIAKVGGVSQRELSRIEISFCFLADFKLRVDADMLLDETNTVVQKFQKWVDRKPGCEVTI